MTATPPNTDNTPTPNVPPTKVLIFSATIVGILGSYTLGGAPTGAVIAIGVATAAITGAVWNNRRGP
jgi:hypothetical protein